MPIDNSIYLQQQAPDIFGNIMKGVEGARTLADLSAKKRAMAEEKGIRDVFAKYTDKDGNVNQAGALGEIGKINPMKAMEMKDKWSAQELNSLQLASAKSKRRGQLAASATPENYMQIRATAIREGLARDEDMPPQWDDSTKSLMAGYANAETTAHERAELEIKKRLAAVQEGELKVKQRLANVKEDGPKLTEGQKATDKEYGKEYVDYEAGGGRATVDKNLGLLEEGIAELSKGGKSDRSGGTSGILGDRAMEVFNQDAAVTRDKIRSAIQGTLKQVLGGQFTQNEAEAMFNRAYNPRFTNEQNIAKATTELNALKQMLAAKDSAAQYFKQNGTLAGWSGAARQERVAGAPPRTEAPAQGGMNALGINKANAAQAPITQKHPQDDAAIQWAMKNQKDPKAQQILKLNGY
jgi:hypothetical protein